MLVLHKRCLSLSTIKIFNVVNCVKVQGKLKHHHSSSWTPNTKLDSCSAYRKRTCFPRPTDIHDRFKNDHSFRSFHSSCLRSCSQRQPKESEIGSPEKLSNDLLHHLERTSLVDFDNAEAVARLNEAIQFADQLFEVNTDGVEPLVTVLENEFLYLREDVAEKTNRTEVLKNASVTEEYYFVAPPGNIPLEQASKQFLKKEESVS